MAEPKICRNCIHKNVCETCKTLDLKDAIMIFDFECEHFLTADVVPSTELDDLKRDTIPKLEKALERANYYGLKADEEVEYLKAEIERLNAVHADMTESLHLAAEANKDMQVELDAMRGAANSYKRKYQIAAAERETNVKGFIETLDKQRAEIERLEKHLVFEIESAYDRGAKAAVKEFAERLIEKCDAPHWCVWMSEIDDLVKEMTEVSNG